MHTDIGGWAGDIFQDFGENPKHAVLNGLRGVHNGLFYTVTSRYPLGTNVFERDWDLLVVLDACRVDAMREVSPEFDFLGPVGSIWSVGSQSHEWLCKTFTRRYLAEIRKTAHISANPHAPPTFRDGVRPPRSLAIPLMWANWDVVDAADFRLFRGLSEYDLGYPATIDPRAVTDHAIDAGRTDGVERTVAHYFQPHRPYISAAYSEERPLTDVEDEPWEALRTGTATIDEVWELYLDNLRYVLNSVERLLQNYDADTVAITADHGDLFGEFGEYGHPSGFAHPSLKKVPWVETTAVDERTSTPTVETAPESSSVDVDDQLRRLGYL